MTTKTARYKSHGGKKWIEVRVREPQQLFDFRDPSPFIERDLDDDFFEYIVSSAREFSLTTPLKIVIYISDKMTQELNKDSISSGIRSFLTYKIELAQKNLRQFFRQTQFFLAIGVVTLFSCLALAHNIETPPTLTAMSILKEGLIIFGWVSMWKPIELLMFEWYPHYEKLRLYRKLLETELEIHFEAN